MNLLNSYQRTRILLIGASIICFALVGWAGRFFGIPIHPGYEASLLQQPSPLGALLTVAVLLTLCTAIGTLLAGGIHYNAGLLAAAIGLAALSARGGSSRETIFWGLSHAGSPGVFRTLFIETMALGVFIGAIGWALDQLYAREILSDQQSHLPADDEPSVTRQAPALLAQLAVTVAGILLLAPTEAKQQVWAAVGISSLVGALTAESFIPTGRRNWAFLVPMAAGLLGYSAAYFNPAGAITGHLTGSLGALARPLPLDYAAAGTAGAILGHWIARQWAMERKENAQGATQAA